MHMDESALDAVREALAKVETALRPGPEGMGVFYAAFAKAQGAFQPIEKNRDVYIKSDKGSYSFKYADLAEMRAKTTPAMSQNDLCLFQLVTEDEGVTSIRTIIGHASGAEVESTIRINRQGDMKQFGATVTYLRRYVIGPMLGIAADDDIDEDGAGHAGAGNAPVSAAVHEGMRDAKTIGELSKVMTGLPKEERARYNDYYGQRQQELRAATQEAA
ncbi:ERF family protein [Cupriavidus necator]|uniref:ERF family protein n=1 Tax=Cupriavidus necator TaxID=106590 RepID=UPI003ECC44BB